MTIDINYFQNSGSKLFSNWRSVILFGKNVATYKFALAKALLELAPSGKTNLTLEELAPNFSRNICEHLLTCPKQITSKSSTFIEACNAFNNKQITNDELIKTTVNYGFNNVIDAFHVVNRSNINFKFYQKNYTKGSKKIILTDELFKITENEYFSNFLREVDARWNIVEKSWELGLNANLLNYDSDNQLFFVNNNLKRKDVTSARNILNGYQKGKCFYCFADISIDSKDSNCCDVDHYFPHTLNRCPELKTPLDGIWNLVLACPNCNRGQNGKFDNIADKNEYLERLYKRNEFYIYEDAKIRETLINQTGKTPEERHTFLEKMDDFAIDKLKHRWKTERVGDIAF